jgi:glycosyltransferase involved in cell wall biosynthesis
MINPLLISTSDSDGGASRATYRLHQALHSMNINSQMLVQDQKTGDYTVTAQKSNITRLRRSLDMLPLKLYPGRDQKIFFSPQWLPDNISKQVSEFNPDVINFHWTNAGYVQIETLAKLKKPIVLTLHDMWAFTGGCHYSGDCLNYTNSCGTCPQLKSSKAKDLSHWIWERKLKSWKDLDITIVTPSHWLAKCAASSSLLKGVRIEVIPNGLDANKYKPIDQSIARSILGLPQDKQLILFGAMSSTSNRRKGFYLLQLALQSKILAELKYQVEILIIGASQPKNLPDLGLKYHYLGKLNDDCSLALVYAAADVFVAPSLQDNLPNTVMESLACGTPCVAFDIGGMPDMIEHKRNGYLATPFETGDLAQGIVWVLEDRVRWRSLSQRSREKVETEFTLKIQADNYLSLYHRLIGEKSAKVKVK